MARGDIQTVMGSHTSSASGVCSQLATGLVAVLNFAALVASAVVLSPAAAGLVLAGLVVANSVYRLLYFRMRHGLAVKDIPIVGSVRQVPLRV